MPVTIEELGRFLEQAPPRRIPASIRRKKRQLALMLFGLFFVLFSVPFMFLFFPWRIMDELRLDLGHPALAEGTVTAVEKTKFSENNRAVYAVRFSFATADGKSVRGTSYRTGGGRKSAGRVTVEYMPDEPEVCRMRGLGLTEVGYFGGMVAIFPLIGGAMMFFAWRWTRRQRRLLRDGAFARAEVIAVEQTNMKVNNQRRYKISVGFDSPRGETMTTYNAYGAEVGLARKRLESGDTVGILYDPSRPGRVLMVDSLLK